MTSQRITQKTPPLQAIFSKIKGGGLLGNIENFFQPTNIIPNTKSTLDRLPSPESFVYLCGSLYGTIHYCDVLLHLYKVFKHGNLRFCTVYCKELQPEK